jgi:hypothetical protein
MKFESENFVPYDVVSVMKLGDQVFLNLGRGRRYSMTEGEARDLMLQFAAALNCKS